MKFIPLLTCLLSLLPALLPAQTIHYVQHNALGNADGSSWANAFTRLQQALAIAEDGDEIWITKGTYKPTNNTDRYAFYKLPSGVKVYGGFAGTETQLEQRDWAANLTILSGDIGVPGDSTDNSFNILYSYSPNEKTLLDGLVFEEGNATNTDPAVDFHRPTRSGGGIYLDGEGFGYAQLSVVNCIFRRNRAGYQGGGMYANGREGGMAIVRLENCLFERNVSHTYGGGFSLENYFEQPYALEIKGCEFRENYTLNSGDALWLRAHQAVKFSDCKFIRNSSILGGTVFFTQLESNHPIEFSNCSFDKNSNYVVYYSPNLQAINDGNFKFKSCVFSENGIPTVSLSIKKIAQAKFENCLFRSNKTYNGSSSSGTVITIGGVPMERSVNFTNTLFYKNVGREISVSSANINNCIIIDAPPQNLSSPAVLWGNGPFKVSNTLFRLPSCDSLAGNYNTPPIIICDSTNLFGVDPLFVNPSISNFHLQSCSPAINAGMNAILDSLDITTDLDGKPRIRNEVVDMGPYEKYVSLHPSISGQPACAGGNTGVVKLSPDICTPYSIVWSNGVTTGTNTNGLAAGTYIFTATGSNNIPVSDTVVISEPLPVTVVADGQDQTCFGIADGWVAATASGGTPPYVYTWDGIFATFNLPAGTYTVTATDLNGCTGSAQAVVGSPEPMQVFYTIVDASCLSCPDGSIVFDSILGGGGPLLPPPMFNLSPGQYSVTLTDANGCFVLVNFTIGYSSATKEELDDNALKLSPNPTASGKTILIEWLGNEPVTLRILDLKGRILEEKQMPAQGPITLKADWPSGIYQIEIRTFSGKRAVRRWAIF